MLLGMKAGDMVVCLREQVPVWTASRAGQGQPHLGWSLTQPSASNPGALADKKVQGMRLTVLGISQWSLWLPLCLHCTSTHLDIGTHHVQDKNPLAPNLGA